MLIGNIFVGVLYYGIVVADLGATTEPGAPCVLQPHGGAARCA